MDSPTAYLKYYWSDGDRRPVRQGEVVGAVTEEVVRSAEIEGDVLDRASVRSSVARRLGVPEAAVHSPDRRTEGIVEMALAAVSAIDRPLTAQDLYGWQAALFPTGSW